MSKIDKTLCYIGSALLLVMGIFHGSGTLWISGKVAESNAEEFLKDVFPILFAHVSMHLIGLAILGVLLTFFGKSAWSILVLLSLLVLADAGLAFSLGALPPGMLLLAASTCFAISAVRLKRGG